MAPYGNGQSQQSLQEAMDVCRWKEIFASSYNRDLLRGIVHRHCKVVRRRGVLSGQNNIAELAGLCLDDATTEINPCQRSGEATCLFSVQSKCVGLSCDDTSRTFFGGQRATRAAVNRSAWPVRCGERDLLSRAKTWINDAEAVEFLKSRSINTHSLALAEDGFRPRKTQPMQVFKNRLLKMLAAASGIEVLNAQQKRPPTLFRLVPRMECRAGMTQMKQPCWTWGETSKHGESPFRETSPLPFAQGRSNGFRRLP